MSQPADRDSAVDADGRVGRSSATGEPNGTTETFVVIQRGIMLHKRVLSGEWETRRKTFLP